MPLSTGTRDYLACALAGTLHLNPDTARQITGAAYADNAASALFYLKIAQQNLSILQKRVSDAIEQCETEARSDDDAAANQGFIDTLKQVTAPRKPYLRVV